MTPDEAISIVRNDYQFESITNRLVLGSQNIAATVAKHLEPGASILDFGAGRAGKTAVLQTMGYECYAYDDLQDDWHIHEGGREEILSFAKEVGIDFKIAEGTTFPYDNESFDMVMIHDVLEHIHDSPRDLVNSMVSLLKPGGLFFATIPNAVNIKKRVDVLRGKTNMPDYNAYYWSPDKWRGHVREYVYDDMVKLSKNVGLEIIELHGCHHMLHKVPSSALPIYKFITNIFPNWKDTMLLVAKRPKEWKPNIDGIKSPRDVEPTNT